MYRKIGSLLALTMLVLFSAPTWGSGHVAQTGTDGQDGSELLYEMSKDQSEVGDDDSVLGEGEESPDDPLADIRKLRFYNKKSVAKKSGLLALGTGVSGVFFGGIPTFFLLGAYGAITAAGVTASGFLGGTGGNAFCNTAQYKKLFKLVEASYIHQGLIKAKSPAKAEHARTRITEFYDKYLKNRFPTTRLTETDVAKQFVKAHKLGFFTHKVKAKVKKQKAAAIIPQVIAEAHESGYTDSDLKTNPEPELQIDVKRPGWMKLYLSDMLFANGSLVPVDILVKIYNEKEESLKELEGKTQV